MEERDSQREPTNERASTRERERELERERDGDIKRGTGREERGVPEIDVPPPRRLMCAGWAPGWALTCLSSAVLHP